MATTTLATVKIDELSKFGFKSGGEYINWSKTLKDDQKVNVVPGRTFQMELYVADSGKKYVNKVVNMVETADVPAPKKQLSSRTQTLVEDKPMLRADWDAKDRRISRQGSIQKAYSVAVVFSSPEELKANAERIANDMLEFVNK